MSATVSINQRNGSFPGIVTQNVSTISWKAVDDSTTPYTAYNASLGLGTNSYAVYAYLSFNGQFTTISNVQISYLSGSLPTGIKLMTSPSITKDSQKLYYNLPSRLSLSSLTPNNFFIGQSVNLLLGQATTSDPGSSPHKQVTANNYSGSLYSNYFVSQLQVANNASPGIVGPITLQITYNEV
jgi:hypothetical protein